MQEKRVFDLDVETCYEVNFKSKEIAVNKHKIECWLDDSIYLGHFDATATERGLLLRTGNCLVSKNVFLLADLAARHLADKLNKIIGEGIVTSNK